MPGLPVDSHREGVPRGERHLHVLYRFAQRTTATATTTNRRAVRPDQGPNCNSESFDSMRDAPVDGD